MPKAGEIIYVRLTNCKIFCDVTSLFGKLSGLPPGSYMPTAKQSSTSQYNIIITQKFIKNYSKYELGYRRKNILRIITPSCKLKK
jgi:hypothetical protein